MPERKSGAHRLFESSLFYRLFQSLIGANQCLRQHLVAPILAKSGTRILDVGCGPGTLYSLFPKGVDYVGVDVRPAYIESANHRYGATASFICDDVGHLDTHRLEPFEVAVAACFLHHLDDKAAVELCAAVARHLTPGGRFYTLDSCWTEPQSAVGRFLIAHDRGRHTRRAAAYKALASTAFSTVAGKVVTDCLRIPYTHYVMTCTRD